MNSASKKAGRTTPRASDYSPPQVANSNPPGGVPGDSIKPAVGKNTTSQQFDVADFRLVELPGDAKSFALDPIRGSLCIAGPWPDTVGIIQPDGLTQGGTPKAALVDARGEPTCVAYATYGAGGVFVVGRSDPPGLLLINSETNKAIKSIPLTGGYPKVLATSSQPGSQENYPHYVYCSLEVEARKGSRNPAGVARLNLATFEVDEFPDRQCRDLTLSVDGNYLYLLATNSSTEPVRMPVASLGEKGYSTRSRSVTEPRLTASQRYCLDPRGLFAASGTSLFTADLDYQLKELEYDPQAIFANQPWMVGLRRYELIVGSTNDGRILATAPLPVEWLIVDEERRKSVSQNQHSAVVPQAFFRVIADDARDRFLVAMQNKILTVPLKELKLPDEPHLAVSTQPRKSALVGDHYEFPVDTISGKSATVELIKGPDGAKLDQQVLRWSPVDEQVGYQPVHIRVKSGSISHDYQWNVLVNQLQLELPFLALGCCPAPDGQLAFVWGNDWPTSTQPNRTFHRITRLPGNRFAIVDLLSRKIVVEKAMTIPIETAAFDKSGIYAVEFRSDRDKSAAMMHLSIDDLRTLHEVQVPANGILRSIGDQFLSWTARGVTYRYSIPKLQPLVDASSGPTFPPTPSERLADGWLVDGVLWDETMAKPKLLPFPSRFAVATFTSDPQRPSPAFRGYVIDGPSRQIPHIDPWSTHTGMLTPDVPAILSVKIQQNTANLYLEFAHLMSGKVLHKVKLHSRVDGSKYPYQPDDFSSLALSTTKDHVLVTHLGVVYVARNPAADKILTVPFRIDPVQSTLTLSTRGPTKVSYIAEGATKFELSIVLPDNETVNLESPDGVFELDGRAYAKLLMANFAKQPNFGGDPGNRVVKYHEAVGAHFKKMTGKTPIGAPLLVPVKVQAYGQDLSIATLQHNYLIDVP